MVESENRRLPSFTAAFMVVINALVGLDRNNLVLDLKHFAREIWLISPQVPHLDRNNLVSAQILILPAVAHRPTEPSPILTGTTTLRPPPLLGQSPNRPGTNQD